MKYGIIGSRSFNDYMKLLIVCDRLIKKSDTIVSGGAVGADLLAKKYAIDNNINYIEFLPDWSKHGKSAGFVRNIDIVENSEFLIVFWDGESKGSSHSISLAKTSKKPTLIVYF